MSIIESYKKVIETIVEIDALYVACKTLVLRHPELADDLAAAFAAVIKAVATKSSAEMDDISKAEQRLSEERIQLIDIGQNLVVHPESAPLVTPFSPPWFAACHTSVHADASEVSLACVVSRIALFCWVALPKSREAAMARACEAA